jgi:hypothetical protein
MRQINGRRRMAETRTGSAQIVDDPVNRVVHAGPG